MLEVHYNLDANFCDTQDFKQPWRQTKVPGVSMIFFSLLINWVRVKFIQDICEIDKFPSEHKLDDDEENDTHMSSFNLKSLFQVIYYHAAHGRHKTQRHVINAHPVYEKCMSRELIVAFNKHCMCISYKSIKNYWFNLVKLTVPQSLPVAVALTSHFDTQRFIIVALDKSDYADRNSQEWSMMMLL